MFSNAGTMRRFIRKIVIVTVSIIVLVKAYSVILNSGIYERQNSIGSLKNTKAFLNPTSKNIKQKMPKATVKLQTNMYEEISRTLYKRKGTFVILASYYRSGSTFTGQIFNQNPDAFYLFEPMYPYTFNCDILTSERENFIRQISQCDFRQVPKLYKQAFEVTNATDVFSR